MGDDRRSPLWAVGFLGLLPLGCAEDPPARPPPPPVVAPARPAPDERARAVQTAALVEWLREQSRTEAQFHDVRTLYTWTRAEQVAELREGLVLLTRSRGAGGARSGFDHALAADRSPLARHLRSSQWQNRRFAWTSPWATRMGWPGSDYGDRLVRVELRPEAWIARFDPDAEAGARWEVRDGAGRSVSDAALRATPWRVAAVYHAGRGPGPDAEPRLFREYVLVSEPMIRRFSVGSASTLDRLARDRAQLEVLADRLAALELPPTPMEAWNRALASRWREGPPAEAELLALYQAALSLGSELYTPAPENVRAAARALELPAEPELVHEPEPRRARADRTLRGLRPHPNCDPTMMGCIRLRL